MTQPEPRIISKLLGMRIVMVAAGENHTLALTSGGDIFTWGSERFGQCGHGGEKEGSGSHNNNHNNHTQNNHIPHSQGTGTGTGSGSVGGSTSLCLHPRRVESLRRCVVVAIAAGDSHSVCFTDNGELYTWGSNKEGQLGIAPSELGAGMHAK